MGYGIVLGGKRVNEDWGTKRKKLTPEEAAESREKKKQYMKDYMPGYRAEHREELRRNSRKCVPPLSVLVPGYVPLNAMKPLPPKPGGEDCENCPFDNCTYPEDPADVYIAPDGKRISQASRRKGRKVYAAKLKERRAEDPELDAKVKEDHIRQQRKHRAKIKFVKAGGTPERFEALWAKAEGDRDIFASLCAEAGIYIKWKKKSEGDG